MAELTLQTATASDPTKIIDYSVASLNPDNAQDQDETEYQNAKWTQQWGYFNDIAELKSAIIMKAIWNVGKGWTADPETSVILDHISGWGKDTFDDILFNMEIVKRIGGDAYAEIMKADDGTIINLKPLDAGSIKIITDKKGIIKRYEQINNGKVIRFEPQEIFHLSNNRIASQIHGISDITALEKNILAAAESFDDLRKIAHRGARPMIMFKLGTDNQTVINAFVTKMDNAVNTGANIYIPDDKNSVNFEVVKVDVPASIMAWRTDLRNQFYRAVGLPQVIFGQAGATESGGKIEYLAHEQVFSKDQRALELQIWNQLNLKIKLNPPTTLLDNLQRDEQKDAGQGLDVPTGDITSGMGQ